MNAWNFKILSYVITLLLCTAVDGAVCRHPSLSASKDLNLYHVLMMPPHHPGISKHTQDDVIHSPEIAAQRLYDAWRRKNRAAALQVAPQETVGTLFARRWVPMKFKGCNDNPRQDAAPDSDEMPSYRCTYVSSRDGATLDITVTGGASVGFSVSSVTIHKRGDKGQGDGPQLGNAASPSVAAARLFDAWKRKDRRAALRIASQKAVDKLFSANWHPMKLTVCNKVDGAFQCIYHEPKIDYNVSFSVSGTAATGYRVEEVSFSSEE